jgi:hypothetical protein
MARQVQTCLVASLVLASVIVGLVGLPVWLSVLCGLSLSLIAIRDQERLRPRFVSVRATNLVTTANMASLAESCLVTGVAWCLGAGFKFVLQSI